MIILPAIDIRGGRCVRLRQGRFDEETVFDEDPAAVARRFEAAGAEWLHVVDLDGAREGEPRNLDRVRAIREAVGLKMEVGGGIRTEETLDAILDIGVQRAIIGTRAVTEPEWVARLVDKHPDKVAISLDAHLRPDRRAFGKDGSSGYLRESPEGISGQYTIPLSFVTSGSTLATKGWQHDSGRTPKSVLEFFRNLDLGAIICTDISRDGMMAGLMVAAIAPVIRDYPGVSVIASGGVTTVEEIRRLKEIGAAGAIIGRALYEGKLTLEEAFKAAAD
ncbi:MAG: 1-(5-phosphoribosyl)-5-[(5-phosphoribosylamino)methylideneamino] imidazole-4-carboxamide isomerase [Planctomycetota bacterium]|nr:1-(5-phosphoribosyl)-5-[(5-phosphoribosylamino)methylideneamino] imidazole-4-carboxamide isomerase [Planctomycetota bacterium]